MTKNNHIVLRSLAFNLCFMGWSLLASILCAPLFIMGKGWVARSGPFWAEGTLFLARKICRITFEVRGEQHMTSNAVIYASKHQSAWDTVIFLKLFHWPAYVLKKELLKIPFWGWYLWRMKMIAIDRSGKAASLKQMVKQSKQVLFARRPIVIFPEGTRKALGDAPDYQVGISALYNQLHVPVVPVALNSGAYWGKNAFMKYPGTIIIEFLPSIEAGLGREEFMSRLQKSIETASQKLLDETKTIKE